MKNICKVYVVCFVAFSVLLLFLDFTALFTKLEFSRVVKISNAVAARERLKQCKITL